MPVGQWNAEFLQGKQKINPGEREKISRVVSMRNAEGNKRAGSKDMTVQQCSVTVVTLLTVNKMRE